MFNQKFFFPIKVHIHKEYTTTQFFFFNFNIDFPDKCSYAVSNRYPVPNQVFNI